MSTDRNCVTHPRNKYTEPDGDERTEMPYKDPERRRLAERQWRRTHREQRAAYMRRYRTARRSGRRPGRPRSENGVEVRVAPSTEWVVNPGLSDQSGLSASPERFSQQLPPVDDHPAEAPPHESPRDQEELPPSPSSLMSWDAGLLFPRI